LLPAHGAVLAATPAPSAAAKLRSDLAALVSGQATLDSRIPKLVAGSRAGELPYFAYLTEPNDASHRAALEKLGARVLRSYRTLPVVALASSPTTVLRVASTPWVSWLAPIELVFALADEPIADQGKGTTQDVGAPDQWAAGITGAGVRIAILDTGVDPSHPDLDDQDFRNWSSLLPNPPKVVARRDFNGGGCAGVATDGHGHGTHVAGIAAGTGEGSPDTADNGRYTGIAPGAELAVGKVLTDAGAGINSDLIAAMEWAARPDTGDTLGCSGIGADIVNMSIGSEARPDRLNSDSDVDMVSLFLDRLAVRYGTLFVAAAGNSGPYIGSLLEAPGAAAQALSVAAAAKDYDVNHDDTLSGDTCSGWQHPPTATGADDCSGGVGTQPPSLAAFSSRGPSGDVWLRPDIAGPGVNLVSAQSPTGTAIAQGDLNRGTRGDPLYATASGTSMATPATSGSAALVLQAYRTRYGMDPKGASGQSGIDAPTYALLRAALMNSAGPDLYEASWILTTDDTTRFNCPQPDPLFGICSIPEVLLDLAEGSTVLAAARNRGADPFVGPLAEGAGKLQIGRAVNALRDGLVAYSVGSGSGATFGTGHRDFQGSWQVGAVSAGSTVAQRFVVHAAPGAVAQEASFAFDPGHPSDGSNAIPTGSAAGAWSLGLPGKTNLVPGGNAVVTFNMTIPAGTPAGTYTGRVLVTTSTGQVIRIPVFASVALHDPDPAAGNAPGPQAKFISAHDVYGKDDTTWPSVAGTAPSGTNADWLVFPVELAANLSEARFSVYDTVHSDTYDLYLYDSKLDLITSTHPFAGDGVTDVAANAQRGPSTQAAPQVLSIGTPASGRHYLAVSRARIGGTIAGASFGAFALSLDEIRTAAAPKATQLGYEGDYIWTAGAPVRLAARLADPSGSPSATPIAGRDVTFTVDGDVDICGGPCVATTDYDGIAQLATAPIALAAGVHEVHARFAGDPFWLASGDDAFVIVVGGGGSPPPPGGSAGKVTAGGWFLPSDATGTSPAERIHFAFQATSPGGVAPTGELRYRDEAGGLDLTLVAWTTMVVNGNTVTLSGTANDAAGIAVAFFLTVKDVDEPGRGRDTIRLQLPDRGYDRGGTLGGGNVQLH
jgi:subtilisin family serine protease